MLSNIYVEVAISERTCREWFQRFKNDNFDVEDRHSEREVFSILDFELIDIERRGSFAIFRHIRIIGIIRIILITECFTLVSDFIYSSVHFVSLLLQLDIVLFSRVVGSLQKGIFRFRFVIFDP
ncbi:hypothetical protein ALC57_11614 [Trachymyrmex cornetzi]|uniref:Mos1 transposase HTH domain-containing protein n=1 Tax=Trachymyrmex cornetzi TaxID=471704 RepID=A0A195DU72_9HYME|nr:hypothetical protein ALC57_11614 [Trachymyrmex cornetzi]